MNTIRTLTVNGSTYPLPDPQSVLDDSTQSPSSTWSSRKIAAVEEAASIVCDAAGGQITLTDASNRELQGLTLYGKTTQNGIPTPETPVPLESAGAGGSITVTVSGGTGEQTFSASTPNGLPGIPVSSGGNYTDENGQAWICDEIDFARGVYVQRVEKIVLDGTETSWQVKNNLYFSVGASEFPNAFYGIHGVDTTAIASVGVVHYQSIDFGGYGFTYAYSPRIRFKNMNPDNHTVEELKAYLAENPITLLVPCKEPTETALSAEALEAYAALHTVKPNTTVYNDSGAGMTLRYTADTKTYIDRKLAALTQEVTA